MKILKEFPKQLINDCKSLKKKSGRIMVTHGKKKEQKCFSPLLYFLPQKED